jgi:hypothetical protein
MKEVVTSCSGSLSKIGGLNFVVVVTWDEVLDVDPDEQPDNEAALKTMSPAVTAASRTRVLI